MSRPSKLPPNNSLFAPLAIGFSIGVITIGTTVLVWHHDRESRSTPVYRTSVAATANPAVQPAFNPITFSSIASTPLPAADPAVARVASRFDCSCGECSDKLDVCRCETAQAERAFIQKQLQDGSTEAEAVNRLKQKYGGLRSLQSKALPTGRDGVPNAS